MKRKIVKHGSATLTISIPSKWAKYYNINPGDELDIEDDKGRLIIRPPKSKRTIAEASIDLTNLDEIGWRCLRALFKGGVDIIRVRYDNKEKYKQLIAPTLNEFIGFEIFQQNEDTCVIKEVSGLAENTDLDGLIRRLFLMTISFSSDVCDAIQKRNTTLLPDLIDRDLTINRISNFARRILNKRAAIDLKDVPIVYFVIEKLEHLGDELKFFCKWMHEEEAMFDSDSQVISLMRDITDLMRDYHSLYFKYSNDVAEQYCVKKNDVQRRIQESLSKSSVEETRALNHLHHMSLILAALLGPLLTMKLPEFCKIDGELGL